MDAKEHLAATMQRRRPGGSAYWSKSANERWISEADVELTNFFAYHAESKKHLLYSNQEANRLMIKQLENRYGYAKVIIWILLGVIANAYGW